jgi:hypothetical protein
MPWINGTDLTWDMRRAVKDAFPYRWTVENYEQAKTAHDAAGLSPPPATALVPDRTWIDGRSFQFVIVTPARKGRGKECKGKRGAVVRLAKGPCRIAANGVGLSVFSMEQHSTLRGPQDGSET